MNYINKIGFILLMMLVSLTSCKKFLEEKSQDEVIPTTTKDFIELLNGTAYIDNVRVDSKIFQQALTLVDDDVRSNYAPTGGGDVSNRQMAQKLLPLYSWQPDVFDQMVAAEMTVDNFNAWMILYKYISGANIALQYADSSVGSESDKNYLKGQAYALRAYYYFLLVNFYGLPYNDVDSSPDKNLGVPLVLSSDYEEENRTRNTVAQVYTQVVSDLQNAIRLLEIDKRRNSVYRINDLSAHFLLAKVYLYMENWEKVIEHTNIVLQEKSTLTNLNTWGTVNNQTNPFVKAANVETIFCYGSPQDYFVAGSQYVYCLSEDLINQFESTDLRKSIFIIPYDARGIQLYGYPYYSGKLYTTGTSSTAVGTAFRTAELYLNRAEANIQLYKKNNNAANANSAIDDLNTLRASRFTTAAYQPWTFTNIDQLYADYKNERRRELCAENQRWFDLRRYGMPSIKHIFYETSATDAYEYTLPAKDPSYVFQIPQQIIDRNPDIVQNPRGAVKVGVKL